MRMESFTWKYLPQGEFPLNLLITCHGQYKPIYVPLHCAPSQFCSWEDTFSWRSCILQNITSLLTWDNGQCQKCHSRPNLSCSVCVKTLKKVESGLSPYILKLVFWTLLVKDVPFSSVKMERRWNFFLLMCGTWIKCLVWYTAARNLAAVEQP
jgi:hypothetical protein